MRTPSPAGVWRSWSNNHNYADDSAKHWTGKQRSSSKGRLVSQLYITFSVSLGLLLSRQNDPCIYSNGPLDTQSRSRQTTTTRNGWRWGCEDEESGVKWKNVWEWMGGLPCEWIVIWESENTSHWCKVLVI